MFPGALQISHYMMSLEYLLSYNYFACVFFSKEKITLVYSTIILGMT